MQINQVLMTPQWASELLSKNDLNRKFRPAIVQQIALDIECGRWKLTPQTVSVDREGMLMDGQHRLMAIESCGLSVPLMLATDCDPECFTAIDTGVARSPGDILKIEGASNCNHVGAIIRLVHLYKTIPNLVWVGNASMVSKQQIIDIYRSDPDGYEAVTKLAKHGHRAPCVQVSAVGAFLYLYSHNRSEDLECSREYFRLFCSGEMLTPGNPILAFRNWQASNWGLAHVKKPQIQLACHIKAYKSWKNGTTIKCFKVPQVPPMPHL